jgi:hypothetical protein
MTTARIVVAILVSAAVVACASHAQLLPGTSTAPLSAVRSAAATPAPHAIITLGLIPSSSSKPGLDITLQVGGGPSKPFLFDTGSQGLFIYDNAIGKSYTATGVKATNTYGSNIVYDGSVVLTTVTFENANRKLVTGMVPVVSVDSATCVPNTTCPADYKVAANCPNVAANPPRIPGVAGIRCLEEGRGLYGTFGADLGPTMEPPVSSAKATKQQVVYNLLYGIAPWSSTFIVDQTQLQLGPDPHALGTFKMIAMTPATLPTALPNGAKPWASHAQICYTISRYVKTPVCRGSLFDTGASDFDFQGKPATIPTDPSHCEALIKGLKIGMYTPGSTAGAYTQIESLTTGYTSNWNAVVTSKAKTGKKPQVNTGLTFYNRDEIFFDAVHGRIGLSPLAQPGTIGKKLCTTTGQEPTGGD